MALKNTNIENIFTIHLSSIPCKYGFMFRCIFHRENKHHFVPVVLGQSDFY